MFEYCGDRAYCTKHRKRFLHTKRGKRNLTDICYYKKGGKLKEFIERMRRDYCGNCILWRVILAEDDKMPLLKDNRKKIKIWRNKAIKDGWVCKRLYGDVPKKEACKLERRGKFYCPQSGKVQKGTYVAFVFSYKNYKEYKISIWAPDGIALDPPVKYSWKEIQKATWRCMDCGKLKKKVYKVGFAGRVCKRCRPEACKRHEHKNWTH